MEKDASLLSYLQQTMEWSPVVPLSREELEQKLAEHINQLIIQDFQRLVGILYTIDVNEQKLKNILRENPGEDAGKLIAGLIIERQLQKIKSRQDFKTAPPPADEEEKW